MVSGVDVEVVVAFVDGVLLGVVVSEVVVSEVHVEVVSEVEGGHKMFMYLNVEHSSLSSHFELLGLSNKSCYQICLFY